MTKDNQQFCQKTMTKTKSNSAVKTKADIKLVYVSHWTSRVLSPGIGITNNYYSK